jgi:hypothetical protein
MSVRELIELKQSEEDKVMGFPTASVALRHEPRSDAVFSDGPFVALHDGAGDLTLIRRSEINGITIPGRAFGSQCSIMVGTYWMSIKESAECVLTAPSWASTKG